MRPIKIGVFLVGLISLLFTQSLVENTLAADSRFMYYTCDSIHNMAQTGWSSQNLNNPSLSTRPLDSFWEVQGPASIRTISYWIFRGVLWETVLDNNFNIWVRESVNGDFTGLKQQWKYAPVNAYQNWQNMGLQNSPPSNEPIKAMLARKYKGIYEQMVITDPPEGSPPETPGKVYVLKAKGPDTWEMEKTWSSATLDVAYQSGGPNKPPNRITSYSYRLNDQGNVEEIIIANKSINGTSVPYVYTRKGQGDDTRSMVDLKADWASKPLSESWSNLGNNPPIGEVNSFNTVPYKGVLRQIATTPTKAYFIDCFAYPQSVMQQIVNTIDVYSKYYIDSTDYSNIFTGNFANNNFNAAESSHLRGGMFRSVMANAEALAGRYFVDKNPDDKAKALQFLNATIDRYGNPDSLGLMGWEYAWLSSIGSFQTARLAWIFWDDLTPQRRTKVEELLIRETQALVDNFKGARQEYQTLMAENGGNFNKVAALMNADQKLRTNVSYTVDSAYSDAQYNFSRAQIDNMGRFGRYYNISHYINDTKAEDNDASAEVLALAANMFPNHSKAAEWDQYAKCYAFHTNTTGTEEEYCGIRTKNIYNDYRVANHDMLGNPLYTMAAISGLTYGEFAYIMVGKAPPSEFRHNRYNVWNRLFNYFYYTDNKQDPDYKRNFEIKEQYRGDWGDTNVKLMFNIVGYEAVFGDESQRPKFIDWEKKLSEFFNSYRYHKLRMQDTPFDNSVFSVGKVIWCFPGSDSRCNNTQNNRGLNDQVGQWFQNSLDARGGADVIFYHLAAAGNFVKPLATPAAVGPATVTSATFNGQIMDLAVSTPYSMKLNLQNGTTTADVPVVIDYSNGTQRYLVVRFRYQSAISSITTPTVAPIPTAAPVLTPTPTPFVAQPASGCNVAYSLNPAKPERPNTDVTVTFSILQSPNLNCVALFQDGVQQGCYLDSSVPNGLRCTINSGNPGTHTLQLKYGQASIYPAGTNCGSPINCNSTIYTTGNNGVIVSASTPPVPLPPAVGGDSKGWLDVALSASCTVAGWTCQEGNFNNSSDVRFYTDGNGTSDRYLGTAKASSRREQAVGNECGGVREYGYAFTLPEFIHDGKPHQIYAYGVDVGGKTGNHLKGSPKTITCAPY